MYQVLEDYFKTNLCLIFEFYLEKYIEQIFKVLEKFVF